MAGQGSKLWDEKPIAGPARATTPDRVIQQITIKELYFLWWKVAIAGFLFALPFLVIWAVTTLR